MPALIGCRDKVPKVQFRLRQSAIGEATSHNLTFIFNYCFRLPSWLEMFVFSWNKDNIGLLLQFSSSAISHILVKFFYSSYFIISQNMAHAWVTFSWGMDLYESWCEVEKFTKHSHKNKISKHLIVSKVMQLPQILVRLIIHKYVPT